MNRNGWKSVAKISGAILGVLAVIGACWTGTMRAMTTFGGVASEADVEQLEDKIDTVDIRVDSVSDTVGSVEMRADSLRRDVRAILWIVCKGGGDSVPHPRCERAERRF